MQMLVRPLTGPIRSRMPRRNRLIGAFAPGRWKVKLSETIFPWNCWKKVISSALRMTSSTARFMESWKGAQMSM